MHEREHWLYHHWTDQALRFGSKMHFPLLAAMNYSAL